MFGILFGVIGLVFSLAFGLVSGTTKVALGTTKIAVGTTTAATKFTLGLALSNLVRAATLGLVGYLVYELIVGYTQGKAAAAPAKALPSPTPAPAAAPAPAAGRTPAPSVRAPLTGPAKQGQAVHIHDSDGTEHTARVGRGVIRR